MADYVKPVVFKVGNESYGVDINLVQSIENDINIVPVPNSITYVKGIVNLRGEVIPVYSLKRKFNMPDDGYSASCVIISTGEIKIALEVDTVVEISDISPDMIIPMPLLIRNAETVYMDRVANANGKLIVLLDVQKLLTDEESEAVKKLTEDMK